MKKLVALSAIMIGLTISAAPAFSWGSSAEELDNAGFSCETIRVANLQRSRMEGVDPIRPRRTRWQQFWVNVVQNDWIAPTREFGHRYIED